MGGIWTKRKSLWDRFDPKVDRSGGPDACHVWTGGTAKGGYGVVGMWDSSTKKQQMKKSHRLAWEFAFGPIPDDLFVCHRCDNPPCCNPSHLFLGTCKQNLADMRAKGRHSHGEGHSALLRARGIRGINHPTAKLKPTDLAEIRQFKRLGLTIREISDWFKIGRSQVYRVINGETWKHELLS